MMNREQKKSILSPQEVRSILNIDNKEIVNLCKKALIVPKKDTRGQTYFSAEELEKLKRAQKAPNTTTAVVKTDTTAVVNNLLNTLESMEERLTKNMSKVIDEKLDGMDEVVVELIRCKTENETLRQKLNEINKENYHLKNDLNCYKSVGLGLYIKKSKDDLSI